MKTFKIFSMAALALTMAACSNSDDNEIVKTAPAEAATIRFSATLPALGSGATTRTTYTESGTTINVKWAVNDEIALLDNSDNSLGTAKVTAVDTGGNATIEATISGTATDGQSVKLRYPADADTGKLQSQDGTLDYIQNNLDIREASGVLSVSGSKATLKKSVTMASTVAIWKLTLTDGSSNSLNATKVTVKVGGTAVAAASSAAKSAYYLCLTPASMGSGDLTIEATIDSNTYLYKKNGGVTLEASNYYQSPVKLSKLVDLSTLTADYEAQNGDLLTGKLGSKVKISIADGATVTLDDATINGTNSDSYAWAGITCDGDATIILSGTNAVTGFYKYHPGIFIAANKTLTIQGDGSLTVSVNKGADGYAAAIGAAQETACGNIVIAGGTITATGGVRSAGIGASTKDSSCGTITISGGTVTATGGQYGAGIGGGYKSTCGDITISGGTVEATGGESAAAIGGGDQGKCGNITITDGVTKVTATRDETTTKSIGKGLGGTVGTVTVGGKEYDGGVSKSPYTYEPGS